MSESFAQMFEESLANQRFRPGQILTGRVIDVTPDVVVVSAGLKSEAVIPTAQFKNERGEIEVKIGDDVEVALDSVEDGSGETRLSREKAKRARRRYNQLKEKGLAANLAGLSQEILERDRRDSARSVAPLRPAADAVVIDSTGITVDDVVSRILVLARDVFPAM